jgi:tetratricopeptide (TPR) repeat protein
MIQMTFFLKYQSQLRRIRPAIYNKLEQSIVNSIKLYGGNIKNEYHAIIAIFNDESFGFWLDILSIVETLKQILYELKSELYGHICIFSDVLDYGQIPVVLNSLPSVRISSGIWCTHFIQKNLKFFFEFKKSYNTKDAFLISQNIAELKSIKRLDGIRKQYPLRQAIKQFFSVNNTGENIVLAGKDFIGKRSYLHWFCGNADRDFIPPLTIRFGSWGQGLNCFSDALNPEIKMFIKSKNINLPKETDALYETLFMERIRAEYSRYSLQKARRFFQILVEAYGSAAANCGSSGVIILESIQNADSNMRQIVMDYQYYFQKNNIVVYAACGLADIPADWKPMFPSVINCFITENPSVFQQEILSQSLWEIAYACAIFGRYFPAFMFSDLFLEEGKNPVVIDRSLDMLLRYGIIRSKQDPDIEIIDFIPEVEKFLGRRAGYIRGMTIRLLISWTAKGKLKPCFSLLEAIHSLGGEVSPLLALESVRQDVINGTYNAIENALAENYFHVICGSERLPALFYIYKTLKILIYGNEDEIHGTFSGLDIPKSEISNYKAQILTINAFYKMGMHDTSTVLGEIKESLIICQNNHDKYCIAQVYQLFALVNLSKNKLNSAIDYSSFAIENTKHNANYSELALASYYAAACHFIFGNISEAMRLIKQSAYTANISGMEEWAMRADFFSGRLYFETGYYKKALDIFNELYTHYRCNPYSNQSQLISAWMFRTELYLNGAPVKKYDFVRGDGLIFEIEAAYFSGNYQKTVELSEHLLSTLTDGGFLFIEQPDWSSGFAQCELLQISKKDFFIKMISAWRALALSMLGHQNSEEAIRLMEKVIRDKHLGGGGEEAEPNASFYFFANYKILRQANSAEVDRNTAISIAFKRLQQRSSRIDDIEIRRNFSLKHYWNKALFSTAKEHKLI